MKHLTVVIATESQIIAAGVKAILLSQKELQVNPQAVSPSDAYNTIRRLRPSAVIVDGGDGTAIEEVRRAKSDRSGDTSVIGLCHTAIPPSVARLFDGTFSIYDNPNTLNALLKRLINTDKDPQPSDLTPREKEVVVGIVKGLSNKEIASEINVSVNTVMTHRRNIASKLRIHSPAGLTIYAIVSKLVSLDEIREMGSGAITD